MKSETFPNFHTFNKNTQNLKRTSSKNDQVFDPLNPTFHCDVQQIQKTNIDALTLDTQQINKIDRELSEIIKSYSQISALQITQADDEITRLKQKRSTAQRHAEAVTNSYKHAMTL